MSYEMQLMRSLGADSVEEAMTIMQAAGLKPEDIPGLLMQSDSGQPMAPPAPKPPKKK